MILKEIIFNLRFLLAILFIIINKKFGNFFQEHPFYLRERKPIIMKDEKKKKILLKGRKFLDQCLNGIYNKKNMSNTTPKVSSIIPVYNCQTTINAALVSIQNQNLTKLEIILINDFSSDNTSEIITNKQKEDKRIIIINNHKNMGTLYSRSIGALMAKGKYIFCLDNDDMFFDNDIFDYFYKIGKKEKLDLIGFQTVNLWNYTEGVLTMKDLYTFQYPNNYLVTQPELGRWMVTFEGKFLVHNNMIWDKCIRTKIYQKAVNLLTIKRYSTYIVWAEDTSINFIIFNLSKSFKYIHKYGILHYKSTQTASFIQPIEHKIFAETFFLEVIFDFSKNNTDKNLAAEQIIYMEKQYKLSYKYYITDNIKIKSIINKILNCQYITRLNKRKIQHIFRNF